MAEAQSNAKPTVIVTNLKVRRQSENYRTLYATWDALPAKSKNRENQDKFEYRWRYYADKHWFEGESGEAKKDTPSCTYSPPENARVAAIKVKAVPKKGQFTVKWTDWIGYGYKNQSIPTHSVTNLSTGISAQKPQFAEANWSETRYNDPDVISGYNYTWEYFNGRVLVQSDSGTVPYEDLKRSYAIEWSIPADAEYFRVTVTPSPVADYLFVGDPETDEYYVKKKKRTVKDLSIVMNDAGNLQATWKMADVTLLDSFSYEWSYYQDGVWNSGTSGTIPVENHTHPNKKFTYWEWGNIYTTPTVTDDSMLVRFRVLPIGKEGSDVLYNDVWSPYKKYYLKVEEKIIDTDIDAKLIEGTARSYILSWGLEQYKDVASFDYQVQYTVQNSGLWLNHTSGSVDISGISEKKSELLSRKVVPNDEVSSIRELVRRRLETYIWSTTYDAPENATSFRVRVKCNPTYENAFEGTWSKYSTFRITTPVKKVDSLTLQVYSYATRTMQAVCFMNDMTGVASYHVFWEYYHTNEYGKAGQWFSGNEEDVTPTTKQEVYGYGISTFDIPAGINTYRVTVYPNPTVSGAFKGDPETFKAYWNSPSYFLDDNLIFVSILQDTDRSMIATWSSKYAQTEKETNSGDKYVVIEKIPMKYTETFEYQWRYMLGGVWFYESTETLPDISQEVTNPYEAPENATEVAIRIRPVPVSEGFYVSDWSDWISYAFKVPSRRVKKADILMSVLRGSERTIACTWSMDNEDDVLSYSYEWRWCSSEGIWFDSGSSGSATAETPSCTYDAPANASKVDVRIIPEPLYSTSFVGIWSVRKQFTVPEYDVPADGQTPTLSVEGLNLTVQVDTYDEHAAAVIFEIVKDTEEDEAVYDVQRNSSDRLDISSISGAISIIWKSAVVNIVNNRATWVVPIASGPSYKARSRGVNEDGEMGAWSQYSEYVYATPSRPKINKVTATSANSLRVTWSSKFETQHVTSSTVEYVIDNPSYFNTNPSAITSVDIPSSMGKIADITGLETSGVYYFRVKVTNTQGDSEWSEIASQILGTIPSAPTTWSSTTTATVDRDIWLYWVHNSEDQSVESSAILELNVNGTITTHTITNSSGSENYTGAYRIAAGTYSAGAKVKWRVKTKGVRPEYGPYSTQRVVDIFAPPTLGFQLKQGDDESLASGNALTKLPLNITFSAGPASQTPISYNVTIIALNNYESYSDEGRTINVIKGSTVYNKYISTNTRAFTLSINANDATLETDCSYRIQASVTMNSGLTAEFSRDIVVKWVIEDIYLDSQLQYDRSTMTMRIRPYCEDEDGNIVANVRLGVYRREFDGSFTEIATNIANNNRRAMVVDPHPALDYARYRITATSQTTGRIFFYDLPGYRIGETSIIMQWDEEWQSFDYDPDIEDELQDGPYKGSIVKLPYNIDTDESNDLDLELVNYIGRRHPVSYYGTQVGQTANWKADIPADDSETIYALRRLAVWPGDVYVREPSGVGYWANVKVSFSRTHVQVTIPVSISITRVEGGA